MRVVVSENNYYVKCTVSVYLSNRVARCIGRFSVRRCAVVILAHWDRGYAGFCKGTSENTPSRNCPKSPTGPELKSQKSAKRAQETLFRCWRPTEWRLEISP
jgi:hypothetical protein